MVCIFDPSCELLPPLAEGTILVYSTVAPLLYLLSDLLPPPPLPNVHYILGGDEMYCGPYSAGVLHSVSDQIQNIQNCFTTRNKNDQ
jgi:hypothetical protein